MENGGNRERERVSREREKETKKPAPKLLGLSRQVLLGPEWLGYGQKMEHSQVLLGWQCERGHGKNDAGCAASRATGLPWGTPRHEVFLKPQTRGWQVGEKEARPGGLETRPAVIR